MLATLRKLANLIRMHQWWRFKIAPALGMFLLFHATTGAAWSVQSWLHFFLVAASIATAAAYTSLSNDLFDLQSDAAAGKHNRLSGLTKGQRRLLIGVVMGAGLGWAWAMPSATARWLYFALWVNWTLYSAPPVRTKNRGALGALSDAFGSHLLPTALVIELAGWDWRTGILLPAIAIGWSLMWGLRGIVWHQLLDYQGDKQSNVKTWAVKLAPHRLQRIAVYRLFPIELALFAALSWHVPWGIEAMCLAIIAQALLHVDKILKINIVEPGESLALYGWYTLGLPMWLAAWHQPWALLAFVVCFGPSMWHLGLPLAVEAKKFWKLSTRLERDLVQTRRSLHPHRPTLIAVTHDCSRTGAPLILLELLRVWRQHHDFNLVVLSLQSGPLDDDFRNVADKLLFTPDSPPVLVESPWTFCNTRSPSGEGQ